MSAAMNMLAALLIISTALVGAERPSYCDVLGPHAPPPNEDNEEKLAQAERICRGDAHASWCARETCTAWTLEVMDNEGNLIPDNVVNLALPEEGYEEAKAALKEKLVACKNAEPRQPRIGKPCRGTLKIDATMDCAFEAVKEECKAEK